MVIMHIDFIEVQLAKIASYHKQVIILKRVGIANTFRVKGGTVVKRL